MATPDLSLDDASAQLGISRRALSGSVAMLGLKTTRGTDRKAYLSHADVERIQAFRSGQDSKANPMYQGTINYANVPQPQMLPRNYKSYAKEGYRSDPTLYKSINYIITNGAAIPPKLFTDATMEHAIDNHPMLDLLETPNNEQSGIDYREAVIGYLLIAGNSYQFASRVTRKTGPPDELWTLPPDMVHPLLQKPRGITGYKFDGYDEKDNPIAPELIRHDKFWAPDDPTFGLSPIEPAAILIDQNAAARKWNLAVLQNGGRMDGAWTTPVAMGKNERDKLEQALHGKYRGYSNAGKAPVLDGGLTFNPTAYTPTELDWLESIRRNEGGIANTVNIPPQLIGDTSATTYNNMGEAKATSYTEEIFPVLDRIYAGWRRWLQPMFGLKAYLYYDKESVEVVQQVIQAQKEAQFKRAVAAWLQGAVTMNEAREIMGLPDIPGGDVFRFGAVLVRSSELDKYAEQSLAEPAAPPKPMPEPLNTPPAPAPGEPPPPEPKPASPEPPKALMAHLAKLARKRLTTKAASTGDVTHTIWECMMGACSFCQDNDGAVAAIGEEFPNGVTSPEECHRFCKCQAWEISLPADVNPDETDIDILIALYGVGLIVARHDKDVAQQQQQAPADEEDDDEEYAKAQRREDYRAFMKKVLV